jgi:transposase
MGHPERCRNCKLTVKVMLEKYFSKVETNFQFNITPFPDSFKGAEYYEELKNIFSKLQKYRGFERFIRAKLLPKCDFYIPSSRFIVEFDETQHFTLPRKLTLENYPVGIKLGFDKEKWIDLCNDLRRVDNDPPFRDEQRAWYDTIRDFLPILENLQPTIRLFSKDFVWCSLDSDKSEDLIKFREILLGRKNEN